MKFWVGITDEHWYQFLRERSPDEVNFWQPSARRRAVALDAGLPFLFKLHTPNNFIVGGGFFVRYSALPARLAWEAFGEKNGVSDYLTLRRRVEQYRKAPVSGDPEIGCNVLNAPFFFRREDWIPTPQSWHPNIQQGLTFDSSAGDGVPLWQQVEARISSTGAPTTIEDSARYSAQYLTRARLGQGAFRILVTDAYRRRCAVTGERTLPVLEAAHIQPYGRAGPHRVSNGLLLRADLHKLFDDGYLTVTEKLEVLVSRRIREEFENGREYYRFSGQALRWHNEYCFLA